MHEKLFDDVFLCGMLYRNAIVAKTVKVKSELKEEKRSAFCMTVLFLILSLICVAISCYLLIFERQIPWSGGAAFAGLGIIFFFAFLIKRKKYMILRSGVNGEKEVYNILKKLPNGFTVISNPVIENRGKYNELDFAVIGKDALFIIEAKNYRGTLKGKVSDRELTQIKFGSGGKTYEKTVKNPISQSDMQCKRMKTLLYDMKISYTVFPILFFADENIKLDIVKDKPFDCKIIKGENELLQYIQASHGKTKTNISCTKKLIEVLKR